jgi:hypothetical protein
MNMSKKRSNWQFDISNYRTQAAIAISELTGQALLDRLEEIMEACNTSYEQGLDLNLSFDSK